MSYYENDVQIILCQSNNEHIDQFKYIRIKIFQDFTRWFDGYCNGNNSNQSM